jgi:hypothetical protein
VENKLVTAKPSKILDELYATGRRSSNGGSTAISKNPSGTLEEERMLLHKTDGKRISEALGIPELDVELDRAVWQVEKALKAAKELREEKEELDEVSIDAKEQKQGEKR